MKTIVNIVSEQTLPNYLFVKENYEKGDKIIWIVSKAEKIQTAMQCLTNVIGSIPNQKIYLEEGKEENIEYVKDTLQKNISSNEKFCVNLTGGTKIIAIAVYDFFKTNYQETLFFYIPFPKNIIVNISLMQSQDIQYKINVEEYLHLYNLKIGNTICREGYLSFENAKTVYSKLNNLRNIYNIELCELRALKDKNKFDKNNSDKQYPYEEIGKVKLKDDIGGNEETRAERIKNFITLNDIPIKSKAGFISGDDMFYISGGWFEDFVFYLTKQQEEPDDIVCGIEILKHGDERSKNELDIVYTKNNKLYIRECKTGWEKGKMFNEIVYKATAIKSLFGLSTNSSLFAYMDKLSENKKEEQQNMETLNKMGVTYFGKNEIDDELNKLN